MSIPESFLADLRQRVDIVEVVERFVELKKLGDSHKGLCPFHNEKSPSFIVTSSRGTYHCFGCGAHGDVFGFLMKHTGRDFVEAVTELAAQLGVPVPAGGGERAAEPARKRLISTREALDLVELEVHVVADVGSQIHNSRDVSEEDFERLLIAVGRLNGVLRETRRS